MDFKKIQIPNTIVLVSNERALLEYFMQFWTSFFKDELNLDM